MKLQDLKVTKSLSKKMDAKVDSKEKGYAPTRALPC